MENRILAVEGNDDKHFIWQLLEIHKVEECFKVNDKNGVDEILKQLKTLIKACDRLGILIDADLDLQERWNKVRIKAYALGFTLPENPQIGGYCTENEEGKKFGVWLMPNNIIPGMLEDFLKDIVPVDDETLPHVQKFIDDMPYVKGRFAEKHKSKALIRTYLAVQEEPGLPFGTAIKAKYFNVDGEEVKRIVEWIKCVFVN